jgi:hypothetical protein
MIKSLSQFNKKYKHSVNKGLSFHILGRLEEGANWDFDVFLPTKGLNLQRDLVWTVEQKSALIITILRDQKIPPIVVVQNDKDKSLKYNWQVIDGKQRMTTLFGYLKNEFPIIYEGTEYFFNDLPEDCQRQIKMYSEIRIDVHYSYDDAPITDQTKIDLFEEINWLGTPQDINHLTKLKK